ncbi:hypothetical protein Naga_100061g2 [Nannochloropsis gaditana]|uniref:Uncharacterized protein n=1 Tax=Nannochloropsis gaditana TaxID=72520 RepID=W7TKL5_9STRA|nr:hypothetical protein Naga_100061g2 [Nannochloropsis gaditana]
MVNGDYRTCRVRPHPLPTLSEETLLILTLPFYRIFYNRVILFTSLCGSPLYDLLKKSKIDDCKMLYQRVRSKSPGVANGRS